MRRRITAQAQETAAYEALLDHQKALIDHKKAALHVILSRIPDVSTFYDVADLIGRSYEWVRQRLVGDPKYRKNLTHAPFLNAHFPAIAASCLRRTTATVPNNVGAVSFTPPVQANGSMSNSRR